LVSHHTIVKSPSAINSSTISNTSAIPSSDLANDQQYLEACRVDLICSKYQQPNLNDNAQAIFTHNRLKDDATNDSYKPGQLLFLKWCLESNITPQSFQPEDLINFISDMHTRHLYAISTLQLFRAAITHFHHHPSSIRTNERINSFFNILLKHAPPIRLHRPTISLQPTIDHLQSLDSHSISLATLQSKLAFLLGITCFLRPSDLHRIPFTSTSVSDDNILSFEVHSPKEKRQRRRIIKSFQVKAHRDQHLCPVHIFHLYMQRRPSCDATPLFVNSLQPNNSISPRTIQSWISKLINLSTDEKRVSLRSIASSLALQSDIPREDIVTMGNWASSATFENHYHREHLSTFDFTNTLITCTEDSDEDVFYDAREDHTLDFS
ncbi:hypothetical protein BDA99DRAFT_594773, partial [Phascolomyces articulosus]